MGPGVWQLIFEVEACPYEAPVLNGIAWSGRVYTDPANQKYPIVSILFPIANVPCSW